MFKRKKWIRFYAMDEGVADLHPIHSARKLRRKWRSDALERQKTEDRKCPYQRVQNLWRRTMRPNESVPELWNHAVTCPALHAVMDAGYIIPAPADFIINMDGTGVNFEWCANRVFYGERYVQAHIPEQTEGMRQLVDQQKPVLDYSIKLELPWRVQAHPDICFIQQPIAYWDEDRFTVPTGIVDPSYSYEINVQLFWHKLEEGAYLVKAGTPLVQWIPVHRDFLNSKGFEVVIEGANQDDLDNNAIMEYNRSKNFTETTTLSERISTQANILKLNKNIKRFN